MEKLVKLLTKPEAAKILRRSSPSVDRLRKQGALAWRQVGGRVLFSTDDLESFIEQAKR